MRRIGKRDIVAAILIALVTGAAFTSPPLQNQQGLSLDILTTLRWKLIGDRRDPTTSPVVVVAIDGETYETPPFRGSPTQTWTREIGRVLGSITEGGAKVIGFGVTEAAVIGRLPGRLPAERAGVRRWRDSQARDIFARRLALARE